MRSGLARLGTLVLSFAPFLGPACHGAEDPVRASIGATFLVPRGLLTKATRLELRVLEGDVVCDALTGAVTFPSGESGARELAKSDLGTNNCPDNVKFCGDVLVARSATPRVFQAKALADSAQVAFGCTTATIDRDAVPLAIKMFRFLPTPVCGDRTIQPTEQCEPGGTAVCDERCQSTEVLLSLGAPSNKTAGGNAGDKTDPFFMWPEGSGDEGRFLAFYSDHAVPSGGGTLEVGLRVMSPDLTPVTAPPALAAGSIFLPNGGASPPDATAGEQSLPQAAMLGGKDYVVFRDDTGTSADIRMRVLTSGLEAEGGSTAIGINGGATGEDAVQTAPSIAAGRERLFVAWQDDADGTIAGRTVTPGTLTLGNQNQLSTGNGNARPQLAATSKGWVAVWTSDTGIKLRSLDESGTPSGGEQAVSNGGASGGHVASLPDGRFAITWSDGNDIFVQRYDERGVAVAGDQATRINDLVVEGAQTQPAIATTSASGGSYVVVWHDASTGHVRGRFLGGSSGFLFNNVDGTTSEFQASRIDGHARAAPVVAAGGSGPFIAIGWEDKSSSGAGIVARRFPLPTE